MSKVEDAIQALQVKVMEKVEAGTELTPEESMILSDILSDRDAKRKAAQKTVVKKGEGTLWPPRDVKKDHIGVTTVTLDIEDPVTKTIKEIDILVMLYDTWPFSDRKIESKEGRKGHRVYVTQVKPKAGNPDPSTDDEGKPIPAVDSENRTENKAPVTTAKGKKVRQ